MHKMQESCIVVLARCYCLLDNAEVDWLLGASH